MKKVLKWVGSLMCATAILTACAACGAPTTTPDDTENNNPTVTTPGDDPNVTPPPAVVKQPWELQEGSKVVSRPQVKTASIVEILPDLNFSRGFRTTRPVANDPTSGEMGTLDYNGTAAEGGMVWQIAQWACTHNMGKGTYSKQGTVISYDDGGKKVTFDTAKTGTFTLAIKGSEEYTKDAQGRIRDRQENENWPHLLFEQTSVDHAFSADAKHIYMELDYEIKKCESLVDRSVYPYKKGLHAAQFQWFLHITDIDPQSKTLGDSMWFGFSMFDNRSLDSTPAEYVNYDGGKEDSTGLLIYTPSLAEVAEQKDSEVTLPTSVIGEKRSVKFDILRYLKIVLKKGYLQCRNVSYLRVNSTNIGWELPGNFDVEVEVSNMNFYELFE